MKHSPTSRRLSAFAALLALAAPLACGTQLAKRAGGPTVSSPSAPAPARAPSVDEAALDGKVSPCDDFYAYACGGWQKASPIPDDKSGWSRGFDLLEEKNATTLRGILERAAAGNLDPENPASKAI